MTRHIDRTDSIMAIIVMVGVAIVCMVSPVNAAPSITDCRVHVISVGEVDGMRPDGTQDIMAPVGSSVRINFVNSIDQIESRVINCTQPGSIINAVIVGRVTGSPRVITQAPAPVPTITPTITVKPKERPPVKPQEGVSFDDKPKDDVKPKREKK